MFPDFLQFFLENCYALSARQIFQVSCKLKKALSIIVLPCYQKLPNFIEVGSIQILVMCFEVADSKAAVHCHSYF